MECNKLRIRNRGSASIEASIAVILLVLVSLFFFRICELMSAGDVENVFESSGCKRGRFLFAVERKQPSFAIIYELSDCHPSLLSWTVKWRIRGASHSMATPLVMVLRLS